jgi:hypothetical protein
VRYILFEKNHYFEVVNDAFFVWADGPYLDLPITLEIAAAISDQRNKE